MVFNKLKKDKNFRNKVIVGAVIFFFLVTFLGGDTATQAIVPQENCDVHNGLAGNLLSKEKVTLCKAEPGCYVEYTNNPATLASSFQNFGDFIISLFTGANPAVTCTNGVSNGKYIFADSGTAANTQCESGKASIVKEIFFFDDVYLCVAQPEENKCKLWEKPFAGIFDAVFKEPFTDDCSVKAYMVIGTVGMMLLAVI